MQPLTATGSPPTTVYTTATHLIGKEFQFQTFWQGSSLHECFTIADDDHAVQQTSLPESF
jgi:hypothetical protein